VAVLVKHLISYQRAPYACAPTTVQQVMDVAEFADLVAREASDHVTVTLLGSIPIANADDVPYVKRRLVQAKTRLEADDGEG